MLNSLLSFFNKKSSDDTMKLTKPGVKEAIYRDELSKKPISNYSQKITCSCFESSEPLLSKREEKEDGKGLVVMRVKVKMTKQEAARMLSRCKDGGVLEFKDVANELTKIPITRVTLDQSPACTRTAATGSVLKSIPEE
ncbi:hypothetical protein ACLB2K_043789 [Fragaria x ananassa]|uniref:uncharacterized protein LOC105351820 n=1 Tax=Fragaria vesca subsp. vesca TaxID=101020 RepID=UPI0005C9A13C|nr:PREDICTED: uncharacterized protein LOC105351820 [Fragaria vesca subsp. vesca]